MPDPRLVNLKACEMTLFPSMDSLVEVVEYIEAQAPIAPGQVLPLLMLYHNTLIKEIRQDAEAAPTPGTPQLTRVK